MSRDCERVIQPEAENGSIKFKDENLDCFTAKIDLSCVGPGVIFTGRKISDEPASFGDSWADYSESVWEEGQAHRWG